MKRYRKYFIALLVLAFLTPAGLILPSAFHADTTWGEWSAGEIKGLVGYVPDRLEKLSSIWNAPMPDYALKGQDEASLPRLSISYILSAVAGILIITGLILILGRVLIRRDDSGSS